MNGRGKYFSFLKSSAHYLFFCPRALPSLEVYIVQFTIKKEWHWCSIRSSLLLVPRSEGGSAAHQGKEVESGVN